MDTPYYKKAAGRQNSQSVIFVEGPDDAHFLSRVLADLGADQEVIGIVDVEGKANFVPRLRTFLKSPAFTQGRVRTVVIICDGDENPNKIYEEIASALQAAGQPRIVLGEYVTSHDGVQFGIFTLPNINESGDLEKLCLATVVTDPLAVQACAFIDTALSAAQKAGRPLRGSSHKRQAQVYLAGVAAELPRGVGRGYALGYFPDGHEAFTPLRQFLGELVGK